MSKPVEEEISLGFICRNGDPAELESIPLMLESVHKYVDEIACTVTLKQESDKIDEKLLQILKKYEVKVSICIWNDNFSDARNFNLKQCTKNLFFWMDSDDTLEGGENLPALAKKIAGTSAINQIWMNYKYALDEKGDSILDMERERLVVRDIHRWKSWIHEKMVTDYHVNAIFTDKVNIKHNLKGVDLKAKADRNLAIALRAYSVTKEAGDLDPRLVYDLSRSYQTLGMLEEAEEKLREFLKMGPSNHDLYDSLLRLSDLSRLKSNINLALDYANKASLLFWNWPFAYFKLCELYLLKDVHDHVPRAEFLLDTAKKFSAPGGGYPCNPSDLKLKPIILEQEILFRKNKPEKALELIKEGLAEFPNSSALKLYKDRCVDFINRMTAESGIQILPQLIDVEVKAGTISEEEGIDRKMHFYKSIPEGFQDLRSVITGRNKLSPIDGKNRIVIYCGAMLAEPWDSSSVKDGVGGSEEAVINISKHLVALGWRVDVYGNPVNRGNQEGVNYFHLDEYDGTQEAKIFISWRVPNNIYQANEKSFKILWCHDRQLLSKYTPELIEEIDKIFVLSKYHRKDLPEIPDEKFHITRNGIDLDHFKGNFTRVTNEKHGLKSGSEMVDLTERDRDKNQYIYASSPDRGLEIILDNWIRIKEINPKAHLHIFYGFKGFKNIPEDMEYRWKTQGRVMKKMEELKDQGVNYHGKVGHIELAQWFLTSGFWLYPSIFTEISCITAMKAQAAGCIPICNDYAALYETVKHGHIVTGTFDDPDVVEDWLNEIDKAQNDTDQYREIMAEEAKKSFSWVSLAKRWSENFKEWTR